MSGNSGSVGFLYGTKTGRFFLKLFMASHADKLVAGFLRTRASGCIVKGYAKRNNIPLTKEQRKAFRSFRDFFLRGKETLSVDRESTHFISPCDGWLSVFPVEKNSSFAIKGSHYRIQDFLQDEALAETYGDGLCLVFRLCVTDYHHYAYIDDGYQGENHFIPGKLHSVQPIACENFPVYTLNRRSWCLLETDHFGPVVQTEIGALIVGGITNHKENTRVVRGEEKGHFELTGSTIVLLVQKGRIRLLPKVLEALKTGEEYRVELGMQIGEREDEEISE